MEVIKRDGRIQKWNAIKIVNAVTKAYRDAHNEELPVDGWAHEVAGVVYDRFVKEVSPIPISDVHEMVEDVLMEYDHNTAKVYVRKRHDKELKYANPWSDMDERQRMMADKYLIKGETIPEFIDRISIGNPKLKSIFINREALWGGRNLYAIGRDGNITGSNCYVAVDPEDNLDDIYRVALDIAKTYSHGGGQGMNLSKLRPRGMKVSNASNTTPGVMSFAGLYSHITLNTQQDQRRGALMLALNADHPDLIGFVTTKLDINAINGANISIALDDKFMNAIVNDEMWEMRYESPYEIMTKRAKARDLMELIAYANHTMGDPGMLFIDNVNTYHLLSEYMEVYFTATNPCKQVLCTA